MGRVGEAGGPVEAVVFAGEVLELHLAGRAGPLRDALALRPSVIHLEGKVFNINNVNGIKYY